MKENEMPDPETIKEILTIVEEKVPSLLKEITAILYEPSQAKNFSLSVSTFYKELINAGMSEEQAFDLTKTYMSNLNLGGMFSKASGHGHTD